jgi:hypothetical protein
MNGNIFSQHSFRTHRSDPMLHFENIAVEIGDPLPALDREGEIHDGWRNEGLNLGPEKTRVFIRDVRRSLVS